MVVTGALHKAYRPDFHPGFRRAGTQRIRSSVGVEPLAPEAAVKASAQLCPAPHGVGPALFVQLHLSTA
jgi:hypothetical protein